jgi:hypothetical protein
MVCCGDRFTLLTSVETQLLPNISSRYRHASVNVKKKKSVTSQLMEEPMFETTQNSLHCSLIG